MLDGTLLLGCMPRDAVIGAHQREWFFCDLSGKRESCVIETLPLSTSLAACVRMPSPPAECYRSCGN